jgi:VanZ family protein
MARDRSSASWLALVYAALVLYASLYAQDAWRWPPGQALGTLLLLPRSLHQSAFDIESNLLGYLPLGGLLAMAALRSGWPAGRALISATALGALLSYSCEVLQHFVPGRVPALEDLAFNSVGTVAGTFLAWVLHGAGWVDRWQALRVRWFSGDAAFALVLLVLWPAGLLFPAPVPLGLGQVGERLREALAALLRDVPWAAGLHELLGAPIVQDAPLHPLGEVVLVALGLLAPCFVAYAVVAPGWRRLVMVLGALLMAVVGMTLSTLLNFGPQHALSWLGPRALPGLLLGAVAAAAAMPLSRRTVAGLGLMVLTGLVFGLAQAPGDPYFAESLQAWEQGRFVRFHGLAQWIGWLWPYAAMGWLLTRLGGPR